MNTLSPCEIIIRSLLFFIAFRFAEGGKLLVIPQDGSHWLSMRNVVDKLSEKGHQIVIVVPEVNFHVKNIDHYTVRTYHGSYSKDFMQNLIKESTKHVFTHKTLLQDMKISYEMIVNTTNFVTSTCENLLKNETLIKDLETSNFDAMLSDSIFPCGEIIAEHLSIPSIFFLRGAFFSLDFQAARSPSPPSYIPRMLTTFTDHMTYSQRVINSLLALVEYMAYNLLYAPFAHMASEFLHRDVTVWELFSRASIVLLRFDFVFEFPRPVMPNMIFIGGINCANKKPLNQDFEKLVNSSGEHGFVVFSLGSMVSEIPMDKAMDMAEAFRSIPQTVIWRYTGKVPSNLGSNTHLVKWLPQNDLLAHPKARAFITHAGSHGIYEGICNAVPMVMLPLFGDQMDNAKRMESRGAGVTLNVLDMTPEDLINALDSVINKPSYKENVQRLSALHLDRPIHPLDLAVHWVEFVMRHKGAPHLRPAAHDLNWIQYHSLDVFAFLLAVLVTTFFISFKCCAYTCRRCCGRKSRPKSKSKKE
ncbi:UDP-glucuronosyltransferase 1-2-like isoform X4 [Bufo gargarizans]|uniref:UDP-glucuronosyltransferase 1-2-like isoform X4 n=1 Tax=Bufo gargarizans TaxID=30331 RepID=UPI001CF48970|nr:UDP-glucuronosyltransferase 1-2-like isoform X4 [Bufo gargarizans]